MGEFLIDRTKLHSFFLPFYYRSCHIFEDLVLRRGFLEYSVKTESFNSVSMFRTFVTRIYTYSDISREIPRFGPIVKVILAFLYGGDENQEIFLQILPGTVQDFVILEKREKRIILRFDIHTKYLPICFSYPFPVSISRKP